jgi:hypothetical protein
MNNSWGYQFLKMIYFRMKPTTTPRRPSIHGVDENDVDGDVRVRLPPIPTFWRVDVVLRVDVISQVPIRVIRRPSKRRLSRQINERRLNRGDEQKGEKIMNQAFEQNFQFAQTRLANKVESKGEFFSKILGGWEGGPIL